MKRCFSVALLVGGQLLSLGPSEAALTVVAELNRAIDLEISPAPNDPCYAGETLQKWQIVPSNIGPVVNLPLDTAFDPPWFKRMNVGYGNDYTFELNGVCRDDVGTDHSRRIDSATGTSGHYGGTFYQDTTIKHDTQGNEIRSDGMTAVDLTSITIESGAEVDLKGAISTTHGDLTIAGATLRGLDFTTSVRVIGTGALSIASSHLKTVQVEVREGAHLQITDSNFYSELDQYLLVHAREAGQIDITGSRFGGTNKMLWVEDTSGNVEISNNRFLGEPGDQPSLEHPFLTLKCSPGGGSLELTSNLIDSVEDRVRVIGPCVISKNLFRDTQIRLVGEGPLLRDNRIFGQGVWTDYLATDVTISDNIIRAEWTAVTIEAGDGASQFSLEGNSFCVDGGYGVVNQAAGTVDATGNYWGHPTGPDITANPVGEGSKAYGPMDLDPWLTSGPCGTVYIEWMDLVQELPGTDPVAGKPAVLRVYLRNGWTSTVSGVSIEGEMDGLPFSMGGIRVPTDYSEEDIHLGRDSVNLVGLPPPVVGPGEVTVRLHYLDPQFDEPIVEEGHLSYSGLSQRALKLGVWAIDVSGATVQSTLAKMLPFVSSLFPTPWVEHELQEFGLDGEPLLRWTAWARLEPAVDRLGLDSAVVITPVGWLGSFGYSGGRVSIVEAYKEPCQQGGGSTFVLAHELLHAVGNAPDEYKTKGNPDWDDQTYPYGKVVDQGWDVYRGKQGLIHSKVPSSPQHPCSSYQPGDPNHTCNFYNVMATECLPPKWINESSRFSLVSKLALPTDKSATAREPVAALLVPITLWEDGSAELHGIWDVTTELASDESYGLWAVESRTAAGTLLDRVSFEPFFHEVDPDTGLLTAAAPIVLPAKPAVAQIVLLLGTTEVASLARTGGPPTVTVLYPNGGENLSGGFTAEWSGIDPDGDPVFYSLAFRCGDAAHWTSVVTGHSGLSWTVDSADLPGGTDCRARVSADDGLWSDIDTSDGSFSIASHPPEVEILFPPDGASIAAGVSVTLSGYVSDLDGDGPPLTDVQWTSNRSGFLGSGTPLTVPDLATGTHIVTMQATDDMAQVGEDSISITVELAADVDDDELPDWWEDQWGTHVGIDDGQADPDHDLLTNLEEFTLGTDPLAVDSDSDGHRDGAEVLAGTDPLDASSHPVQLFGDGFESGHTFAWSMAVP